MLATDYAQRYGIPAQGPDEDDIEFKGRVSGVLRDAGNFIEAHEVHADQFFDQSDDVMTGIMGAVAQVWSGKTYGKSGYTQVGDDIAVGTIVQHPKPEVDPMMALMAVMMFGGR
jgi:hypothetical protein